MILFKLKDLLHERGMNQRDCHRKTSVDKNTINAYYNGFAKRLNVTDLNKMCDALECELSDLIEYIPDKK
jgi:putative transcriptional regulator